MAKNVFRANELVRKEPRVIINPPEPFEKEPDVVEVVEEYTGPTADDLRREAELFKSNWEAEKAQMINTAKEEADKIIREAEQTAFEEVKKKTDEAQSLKQQAEDEYNAKINEAEIQSNMLMDEAQRSVSEIEKNAHDKGFDEGKTLGWEEGKAEADRLIEHLHNIINAAIEKRNEIIEESETQLINLVLLISKKVIKVISENQKNVVINNVIQALRKMKSRGEVVIRVNLDDVKLSTEHVKDFMSMVEHVKAISVMEDSTVDKGGCIIETDFGQIDARISSQLKEIEEKIIEVAPIKSKIEQ